eukprot:Skav220685  [mRNA]  locus=scaffold472:16989:18899:+ [translate_table: standard]
MQLPMISFPLQLFDALRCSSLVSGTAAVLVRRNGSGEAQVAMAEWEVVDETVKMKAVTDFLENKGLGKYAEKIIEVTDVACLDDFKMIDAQMAEEIIRTLQLKLVTAQKLRQAVAEADSWCAVSEVPDASLPESPPPPVAPQEVIAICIDRSGEKKGIESDRKG